MNIRKPRNKVEIHVDLDALKETVRIMGVIRKHKEERPMEPEEIGFYNSLDPKYERIYDRVQEEHQPLIDAVCASQKLTWRDYAVRINVRV